MSKKKLMVLAALACGGSLFSGCLSLGGFMDGLFGRGWPSSNPWLNIGLDVLNEELFG